MKSFWHGLRRGWGQRRRGTAALPAVRPLCDVEGGRQVAIVALRGGPGMQRRAAGMGLHIGCEVTVMQHGGRPGGGGAVAIRCGETRLALGHGMACKILVRPR